MERAERRGAVRSAVRNDENDMLFAGNRKAFKISPEKTEKKNHARSWSLTKGWQRVDKTAMVVETRLTLL